MRPGRKERAKGSEGGEEKQERGSKLTRVSSLDEDLEKEIRDDPVGRSVESRLDSEDLRKGDLELLQVLVDLVVSPANEKEKRENTEKDERREGRRGKKTHESEWFLWAHPCEARV